MWHAPGETRSRRDRGFTIVELTIVMVVLALLTAIAVPVFLNQRVSGYRTAVRTDLAVAAAALDTWSLDRGRTYVASGSDTADAVLANRSVFTPGTGVTVRVARVSATTFCIEGRHTGLSNEVWVLDKAVGTPTRTTSGC